MFNRRREDRVLEEPSPTVPAELPRIAVSWLQDLLRSEFADVPGPPPATLGAPPVGDEDDAAQLAVWRREWLRRWRRLQLPEQFAAFCEALEGARRPEQVHDLLAEHARQVVGAYVCLLFLPGGDGRLRPLPDPRVPDGAALWLAQPAGREMVLDAEEMAEAPELAGLTPLLAKVGAVALAVAPYAGGAAVLVERRRERRLEAMDRALLRALCAQAEAALHRVALLAEIDAADPETGAAPAERVDRVLRHGWAGAALGHPITLLLVRVEPAEGGGAPGEPVVQHCAAVLRREANGGGPVLRYGARELLLVLHAGADATGALLERARRQMRGRAGLRAGVAAHDPAAGSARDLLRRVEAALDAGT